MPIRIQLAQDERHIEQVFRLRYQIFCEEEGYIQPVESQIVIDRFDAFPASKLFVVLDEDDQVVGSLRVTMDNTVGLPADEHFDFRPHVPQTSRFMSISMFCVMKPYRSAMIASSLLLMCSYHALANDVDYVVAPLNPPMAKLIRRIGAKQVTKDLQTSPHLNVGFAPYLLDVNDMNETFMNFARQNITHNMIKSYECMIFKKGEQIIRKGDIGDCAFVIVQGIAQVMHPVTSEPITELCEGDVFGELELFAADNVRSADVFAYTVTRVMVLPKKAFLEHLRTSPETSMSLLHSMSNRMKSMLAR